MPVDHGCLNQQLEHASPAEVWAQLQTDKPGLHTLGCVGYTPIQAANFAILTERMHALCGSASGLGAHPFGMGVLLDRCPPHRQLWAASKEIPTEEPRQHERHKDKLREGCGVCGGGGGAAEPWPNTETLQVVKDGVNLCQSLCSSLHLHGLVHSYLHKLGIC